MRDGEGEKKVRSLVFSCRIRMVQQRLRKGPHFSSEGVSPREIRSSRPPLLSLPLSRSQKKILSRLFFQHTPPFTAFSLALSFSLNNDYLNNESDKMPNNKEREPDCFTGGFRGVSFNRVCTRL